MDHIKFPNNKHRRGSALILVVVLTALLAVIGTIFLLSSRIESMSTSGIAENKALESAIDAIIGKISDTLTNDVPGVRVDLSGNLLEEYYDYPGPMDTWLASIEPYRNVSYDPNNPKDSKYIWHQITDLTGLLQEQDKPEMRFATQHVKVQPQKSNVIIEYPEILLNEDGSWLRNGNMADTINNKDDGINENEYRGQLADADGDGIADSKWIKLTDVSTGKGKDIYAAIRIIDNGGMINVNTAYGFDPDSTIKNHVDGSTLSNIDLDELAYSTDDIDDLIRDLNNDKNNVDVYNDNYINDILRRIESPDDSDYQPFDISDELALRSRFCVDPNRKSRLRTRWENTLHLRYRTFDSSSDDGLDEWEEEVCREIFNINSKYDRRHMLTCWNMDRIINPVGGKMLGVNGRLLDNMGNYDQNYYKDFNNRQELFKAIKAALNSTRTALNSTEYMGVKAAQIMVNLIDYIDEDLKMTVADVQLLDPIDPLAPKQNVYGFEGPCVYISEIAAMRESTLPGPPADPQYSYAIELYNPYASVNDAIQAGVAGDNWYLQLVAGGIITNVPITWSGAEKFHVMHKDNSDALISSEIAGSASFDSYPISFSAGDIISLMRDVDDGAGGTTPKLVDSITVPADLLNPLDDQAYSIERDTSPHKCIKELWSPNSKLTDTLGIINNIAAIKNTDGTEIAPMQAHPANKELDCIGDIGNIFSVDIYEVSKIGIDEESVKVNLANPIYQNLFQYLTVFDPNNDNIDNDGDGDLKKDDNDQDGPEWKIPGRININTAPWFVLAQLPWVSKENGGAINYELCKAIVAYRDKIKIDSVDYSQGRHFKIGSKLYNATLDNINEDVGFRSIGELNFVVDNTNGDLYSMWRYGLDLTDLDGYPDLTKIGTNGDGAANDFEERDVIFARISNLVTVRSDVFTAYIVVRVGVDGPQQRAIAVFDRSDIYPNPGGESTGKVKIRAFQMVSDIR